MAELKAQTTRGQFIGEKPGEVVTLYAPDGTSHTCSPLDAREILSAGLGYTTEPPATPLTGDAIFDQAYAEIEKRKNEQQPEQQPEPGDTVAGGETENAAKPDNPGGSDGGAETPTAPRPKGRPRKTVNA